MQRIDPGTWVGVDAGKEFHWARALDASGEVLLSHKIQNDEGSLLELVEEVRSLAGVGQAVWAIDQPGGGAALLLALLWEREQRVLYVPGLVVDRARDSYRGESKTDERDAHVIADQARMRGDFSELAPEEGALAEPRLLLARRRDLVVDRTRAKSASLRRFWRSFRPSNAPGTSEHQGRPRPPQPLPEPGEDPTGGT